MRRAPAGLLIAIAAALLASTLAVRADALRVTGNRRVEADTILSYFRGVSPEALDAGVKALYATGLFSDVRIAQHDGAVTIAVVENALVARVVFEGNSKIKTEDLRKVVESKERGAFIRARVQGDVARIVDLYHQRGRFDVHVDPKIIEASDHRVNLVFEIVEGARTGVRQIRFVGNRAY